MVDRAKAIEKVRTSSSAAAGRIWWHVDHWVTVDRWGSYARAVGLDRSGSLARRIVRRRWDANR